MASGMLLLSFVLWVAATLIAVLGQWAVLGRALLTAGALSGVIAAIVGLPDPTSMVILPLRLASEAVGFRMEPEALWLFGFGLAPALFACALGSPSRYGRSGWNLGAGLSLLGALGVFGLQNGAALLVAWETMSLGGAIMILSERLDSARGSTILFMLALLEVGAVALVLAVAILGLGTSSLGFASFVGGAAALNSTTQIGIGLLMLVGFGAKLGLLPFYEWFPGAYGSGSGASGAILSGVVLNAAFFGLSRGLFEWLPPAPEAAFPLLAIVVVVVGTVSAILTILYAFQEDDWRRLLSFSSAENASIAVAALGAAMLFRGYGLQELAGLAWTVSLLHLAGHALAKGSLFLTADGLRRATGSYAIAASGAGKYWLFGVGALLGAMSSLGHAANGWLCQRMVRVPDRLSRLSPPQSRRPTCPRPRRRRACPDGRGCLRHLRESLRHRRARARRQPQCADLAILFRGRWLSRVCRSAAWRWNASLAHRA